MPDIYLRPVPADANAADVRLYDPTVADAGGAASIIGAGQIASAEALGAPTVAATIAAAGVASVLVPFPHAVDDHQTHNARFLAERGAAVLIPQHELTAQKLAEFLQTINRDGLLEMANKARSVAKPDATQTVAEECMRLAA